MHGDLMLPTGLSSPHALGGELTDMTRCPTQTFGHDKKEETDYTIVINHGFKILPCLRQPGHPVQEVQRGRKKGIQGGVPSSPSSTTVPGNSLAGIKRPGREFVEQLYRPFAGACSRPARGNEVVVGFSLVLVP
jgi:hypothetical protein